MSNSVAGYYVQDALFSRHNVSYGVSLQISYCLVMVLLVLDVKKTICGAYMICLESHFVGVMEIVLRNFRFKL